MSKLIESGRMYYKKNENKLMMFDEEGDLNGIWNYVALSFIILAVFILGGIEMTSL